MYKVGILFYLFRIKHIDECVRWKMLGTNLRIFSVFCVFFNSNNNNKLNDFMNANAARKGKGSQCWWENLYWRMRKYKLSTANTIHHLYVYKFVNARYSEIVRIQHRTRHRHGRIRRHLRRYFPMKMMCPNRDRDRVRLLFCFSLEFCFVCVTHSFFGSARFFFPAMMTI